MTGLMKIKINLESSKIDEESNITEQASFLQGTENHGKRKKKHSKGNASSKTGDNKKSKKFNKKTVYEEKSGDTEKKSRIINGIPFASGSNEESALFHGNTKEEKKENVKEKRLKDTSLKSLSIKAIPTNDNDKEDNQSEKDNKSSADTVKEEMKIVNPHSIVSLSFPNTNKENSYLNSNGTVNDLNQEYKEEESQGEKADAASTKKARKWEKKWVLIPNVFDFTKEIWLKQWVIVDDIEEPSAEENFNNYSFLENYYESYASRLKDSFPKKYQCSFEECAKIFVDSSSLKKHMLTHGEKQYNCKYEGCGKKFLDNSKLRRHQLVHTGEKPFKCDLCGKKFSLDFNLKTHLRTHTGEKPYFCSYSGCDKRFTQSSNLTAHEKTHKELLEKAKTIPIFTSTRAEKFEDRDNGGFTRVEFAVIPGNSGKGINNTEEETFENKYEESGCQEEELDQQSSNKMVVIKEDDSKVESI